MMGGVVGVLGVESGQALARNRWLIDEVSHFGGESRRQPMSIDDGTIDSGRGREQGRMGPGAD